MNNVSFPALGLEFEISRVAFSIGSFDIYWYGICIVVGIIIALLYFNAKARSFGIDPDRGLDVIIISGIAGVLGARIYYVIFSPTPMDSFLKIIDIRSGGLAIYGGIIGAFVVGVLACKLRKVPMLPMFDIAAIGFAIGQATGRWGNFFNQEAFGTNTDSIFGMYSESTNRYLASVMDTLAASGITVDPSAPVHPTFLYESIWCLLCFIGLVIYAKHRKFNGEIFMLYLFLYSLERSFVEGLRTDSLMILNARVSQLLAIAICIVSAIMLAMFYSNQKLRNRPMFKLLPYFEGSITENEKKAKEAKKEADIEKDSDKSQTIEESDNEVESLDTNDSDDADTEAEEEAEGTADTEPNDDKAAESNEEDSEKEDDKSTQNDK